MILFGISIIIAILLLFWSSRVITVPESRFFIFVGRGGGGGLGGRWRERRKDKIGYFFMYFYDDFKWI